MPNEPQSYGSQGEWVSGNTGEQVNRPKSDAPPASASSEDRGGKVSPLQVAENAQAAGGASDDNEQPVKKVSDQETGAKRDGYFKRRDYGG